MAHFRKKAAAAVKWLLLYVLFFVYALLFLLILSLLLLNLWQVSFESLLRLSLAAALGGGTLYLLFKTKK